MQHGWGPLCVVLKVSSPAEEAEVSATHTHFNSLSFFSLLQLRPGGRGLPLAEGPGQGPVHPHHRGERRWENW